MTDSVEFQIVPETLVTPTLDEQLVRFLSGIFPEWSVTFQKARAWHDAPPVFSALALNADGRIAGHVAVVERVITTCWNWRYAAASIQGVSVDSDHRGQGIGRLLLAMALDESKKRGYPFAILFCKEPMLPYYQSLGWRLPDDSMVMWRDRELPIPMRSNCPMFQELTDLKFPEGPTDVYNPF